MALSITTYVQDEDDVGRNVLITLKGEMDCATAPDLRQVITDVLINEQPSLITIDVAGITVLDSTGIGTLVVAYRIARDVGVRLVVRNPNRFVSRLFRVIGVAELLGVTSSEDSDADAWPVPPQRSRLTGLRRPVPTP